jgi:hypothetical protein
MAQIVLSGDELVSILRANELIPDHVTDIKTNGEEIKVKLKTPWPVLKSLRVGIRFVGFEDGYVILQLVTNRFMDTFDWLIDKMLESMQLEDHGGRWDYPRLSVDVNRLVARHLRGVEIRDMAFEDGHFRIMTVHGSNGSPEDEKEDVSDEERN